MQKCFESFSLFIVWLCNFWQKNIGAKAAHKILMKLTAGVQEMPIRQVLGGGYGPEVGSDQRREKEKIRKVF